MDRFNEVKKIMENVSRFALSEPYTSPTLILASVYQDIYDTLGWVAWGKRIDEFDGDNQAAKGVIKFGWKEGDMEVGARVEGLVDLEKVRLEIYPIGEFEPEDVDPIIVETSRDMGDYISFINDAANAVRESTEISKL